MEFAVVVEEKGGKDMVMKHRLIPVKETFSEDAAKEVSEKMG